MFISKGCVRQFLHQRSRWPPRLVICRFSHLAFDFRVVHDNICAGSRKTSRLIERTDLTGNRKFRTNAWSFVIIWSCVWSLGHSVMSNVDGSTTAFVCHAVTFLRRMHFFLNSKSERRKHVFFLSP